MTINKRKIRYSAIFFLCWFAFLILLVDGVIKFQTLVEFFGSYALVETTLLLLPAYSGSILLYKGEARPFTTNLTVTPSDLYN